MTSTMSTYKELDILAQVTKQTGCLTSDERSNVLHYYETYNTGLSQLVTMVQFNRDINKQTKAVINLYKMLTK
jgi:hypothetical protein